MLGGESTGEVHIIVALERDGESYAPDAAQAKRGAARHAARAESAERAVAAFLEHLSKRLPPGKRGPVVHRQFSLPAPGVAMTITPDVLPLIRRAPGVIHVETDDPVQAFETRVAERDSVSVETIGAETAWQEFGVSGAGVTIAVLDSGLDYTHPAFGGAIGPDARVRGGYDFVNGDEDPMDDNGHGTHVAGIAAGVDPLIAGVAPAAALLIGKVLDHTGTGRESHILAGIDWAVSEGADIINLSLGGAGHPDDLLGQAVNAAAAAGVVVVAATGNSGQFQDVGTPAAAAGALGVGSISRAGVVSSFSARGPTLNTFAIKPEIVAPGEQILSARPGGGFQVFSGTSMSAPHVAGAVALLMEARPDLRANDVRHLLAASAVSTGNGVFEQGAGLLRVDLAIRGALVPSATSLNLGLIGGDQGIIERRVPVSLRNTAGTSHDMTLRIELQPGGLPVGASVRVEPTELTIAAGSVAEAELILTANTAELGNSAVPPRVAGWLVAESVASLTSGPTRLRLPFSAVKGNVLQLESTRVPLQVAVLSPTRSQLLNPGAQASVLLEEGTYDVVAAFELEDATTGEVRRSVITRRGVEVSGATPISLDATNVSRWIPLQPVGPTDRTADIVSDFEVIRDLASDTRLLLIDDASWDAVGFSPGEVGVRMDWMGRVEVGPTAEPAWIPLTIAPSALLATNSALDLLPIDLSVERGVLTPRGAARPLHVAEIHWTHDGTGLELVLDEPSKQRLNSAPVHRMWHGTPPPDHDFSFFQMNVHEQAASGRRLYDGPLVSWTPDGPALGMTTNTPIPWVRTERPLRLRYGGTAPFWNGRMFQLTLGRSYFAQPPFIRGQDFEAALIPFRFRLLSGEGRTVDQQLLLHNADQRGFRNTIEFAPGEHGMTFDAEPYLMHGIPGLMQIRLRFNSLLEPQPPAIFTQLRLTDSGGLPVSELREGVEGQVSFFHDVGYEADVAIRRTGMQRWETLAVETVNQTANAVERPVATATVGRGLSRGFYDLRVQLRDAVGTTTEVVTSPFFFVGQRNAANNTVPGEARPAAPADSLTTDVLPTLRWEDGIDTDPGDLVFHEVHMRGPGLDTTFVVRESTNLDLGDPDTFITGALTVDDFVPDAWYAWNVTASDGLARSAASTTRHFRLESTVTSTEDRHATDLPAQAAPGIRAVYPVPAPGGHFTAEVVLASAGRVSWNLFDVAARRVARGSAGHTPSGAHAFRIAPGRPLSPGVYALVLTTPDGTYRQLITVGR